MLKPVMEGIMRLILGIKEFSTVLHWNKLLYFDMMIKKQEDVLVMFQRHLKKQYTDLEKKFIHF